MGWNEAAQLCFHHHLSYVVIVVAVLGWNGFACGVAITILGEYGIIFQLAALLINFMDSLELFGVGDNYLLANEYVLHWWNLWGLKLIVIDEIVIIDSNWWNCGNWKNNFV